MGRVKFVSFREQLTKYITSKISTTACEKCLSTLVCFSTARGTINFSTPLGTAFEPDGASPVCSGCFVLVSFQILLYKKRMRF
uniref:Uncharacterized protein n=1 Tax=Arundo donax TaxID=35708 RepID=A0A0A9DTF5_ARUDO